MTIHDKTINILIKGINEQNKQLQQIKQQLNIHNQREQNKIKYHHRNWKYKTTQNGNPTVGLWISPDGKQHTTQCTCKHCEIRRATKQ